MNPIEEKGQHVNPEDVLAGVPGTPGSPETNNVPMAGEELIDREPAHGHHQRDGSRHTVGSPHPVIPFGAEV